MVETKPQGAYIEADAATIDEGKLIKLLTEKLRQAYAGLHTHLDSNPNVGKAKASVTLKIDISKKGTDEYVSLTYAGTVTTPKPVARDVWVRGGGGRLLVDEATRGAGLNDADQMKMFDRHGNLTRVIDTTTGEEVDEDADSPVAGKIAQSS